MLGPSKNLYIPSHDSKHGWVTSVVLLCMASPCTISADALAKDEGSMNGVEGSEKCDCCHGLKRLQYTAFLSTSKCSLATVSCQHVSGILTASAKYGVRISTAQDASKSGNPPGSSRPKLATALKKNVAPYARMLEFLSRFELGHFQGCLFFFTGKPPDAPSSPEEPFFFILKDAPF